MDIRGLAELYELDMKRLTPGWLITWYIEHELIDISLLEDDGGIWNGYIWYN